MTAPSYAGPPAHELPERLARQRDTHRRNMARARLARMAGHRDEEAMFMAWARAARIQYGRLKDYERAARGLPMGG